MNEIIYGDQIDFAQLSCTTVSDVSLDCDQFNVGPTICSQSSCTQFRLDNKEWAKKRVCDQCYGETFAPYEINNCEECKKENNGECIFGHCGGNGCLVFICTECGKEFNHRY